MNSTLKGTMSKVERAARYLEKCHGAIEGQNGDTHTYALSSILVNDFALSETEAWPILLEWNRTCQPPWGEAELRAKLRSALKCAHPKARGNKLDSPGRHHHHQQTPAGRAVSTPPPALKEQSDFTPGTPDQLKRLAASRPYGLEGLQWASERGLLVFGNAFGFECYGVKDASQRALELRRIDNKPFPAVGNLSERKSHAVGGSQKSWPIGILEAESFPCIALLEGIPDLLEAHFLVLWEQASHYTKRDVRCAPVAMLSASPSIAEDAIEHFRGKLVRIFPHADCAGIKGGQKWANQLHNIAAKVELFDFEGLRRSSGEPAKDLYDCRDLSPTEYLNDESLWKMLPQ